MIFETSIKTISKFVAVFIMVIVLGGIYLSLKGYDVTNSNVNAKELPVKTQEASFASNSELTDEAEPRIIGNVDAPVTIYEFSSFSCGHCATFHTQTLRKIKSKYIDTGKAKLVFADFPIGDLAAKASMLTRCIDKDKHESFVNNLFQNQFKWARTRDTKNLKEYAIANGMSEAEISSCLENHKLYSAIMDYRQNIMTKYKINGTPSFVIDNSKSKEDVIKGAAKYEVFEATIEKKLKELKD